MKTISSRWRSVVLMGVVASLVTGGCTSQAPSATPPVELPEAFTAAGSTATPERWWQSFEDPRLEALMERALDGNLNLAAAWQRLRAANAAVDRAGGALYPDLQASGEAAARGGEDTATDEDDYLVGLASRYEVDLWGRVHAAVAAERYRAEASRADYHAAALSLSAAVAVTWYRLVEARSQLALIEAQIDTNDRLLGLLEARFATGLVRAVDILRQRQLLEASRQQRHVTRTRVRVLANQLAVLSGAPPQRPQTPAGRRLPELAPLPETGVPADLVQRRPDLQSARARLAAADRDLATALSNRYPRLTLTASTTSAAETSDALFDDWARTFAGSLVAPLFTGGRLSAEVDRTEAIKQQRLYEYGQAVLLAFQEVEDALVREAGQRRAIGRLERQVELATQAYEQLRFQYFNGDANYLDVLTALDEVQQLRRQRLSADLALVEFRIALYRALAGPIGAPHT